MAPPHKTIRNILFIRTDRLGETLLNLPAAAALKAAVPQAALTLMVQPALEPLLARLPWIDCVLGHAIDQAKPWWSEAWRLARRLREHAFDAVVVSNPMKACHAGVWLARVPVRVGYDRKWGRLLTHRFDNGMERGDHHEVEANLALVRQLVDLPATLPEWRFPRSVPDEQEVLRMLQADGLAMGEPFIVIHPWTSNPRKQWPMERFSALIAALPSCLPCRMVLIGGPESADRSHAIIPAGSSALDLTGRLSLPQLAALLRLARLVLSSDSGPAHLAVAVGTRAVVLFGTQEVAAGPRRWGPWGEGGHRVVHRASMDAITVDEVLKTVGRAW